MPNEREQILLREVFNATAARKLNWQTSATHGLFIATMGGKYTVKLYRYHPRAASPGPSLLLLEGDAELADVNASLPGVGSNQMVDLYELVQRQVYRIDEKNQSVDAAIEILKSLQGK